MERNDFTLDFSETIFHVTTYNGVRFLIQISVKECDKESYYHVIITDKDKELNQLVYRMSCQTYIFMTDMIGNAITMFKNVYNYV